MQRKINFKNANIFSVTPKKIILYISNLDIFKMSKIKNPGVLFFQKVVFRKSPFQFDQERWMHVCFRC
jgi:hypothetical protein